MYFDFNYILNQLGSVGIADVFDIIIVAFVFYYLFKFVRERRAGKLAIGVLFLIVMLFISELANMRATYFILKNVVNVGLIALLIVFQPELRSMLEKMGSEPLKGFRGKLNNSAVSEYRAAIGELTAAVDRLSESKTGALIVIEGSTKLGDVIKTGTVVDAQISSFLIGNIFFNKAPLHDGAVIIRGLRILAAGCFLPLSTNPDIIKDLGTRHRAGIGISENGELKRGFTGEELEKYLQALLIDPKIKKSFKQRFFSLRDPEQDDEEEGGFDA